MVFVHQNFENNFVPFLNRMATTILYTYFNDVEELFFMVSCTLFHKVWAFCIF